MRELPTKNKCEHPPLVTDETSPQAVSSIQRAAAICHALSDPSRLRLLLRLARGEMCVSELVAHEQGKLGSISARLQTLHNARLVIRRREAKHVFYTLADEHVHALLDNILNHAAEEVLPDATFIHLD